MSSLAEEEEEETNAAFVSASFPQLLCFRLSRSARGTELQRRSCVLQETMPALGIVDAG